jgi:hypothetical protein
VTASEPSQTLQRTSPSAMSRLRASSAAFPPGLDLRNQYRPVPAQAGSVATPRSGTFSNAFTGGYPSAPLTAPVDFSLPRTPVDGSSQGHRNDFNIPQMSAPMAPPMDFANAYRAQQQADQRDFAHQAAVEHSPTQQSQGQHQHQHSRSNEDTNFLRSPQFDTTQKRKRSFTVPGQFETA